MTTQEANKIIAEYMGWRSRDFVEDEFWSDDDKKPDIEYFLNNTVQCYEPSYESLDALVPVWEKLEIIETTINDLVKGGWEVALNTALSVRHDSLMDIFGQGKTIQEAACIATAKAIKELSH